MTMLTNLVSFSVLLMLTSANPIGPNGTSTYIYSVQISVSQNCKNAVNAPKMIKCLGSSDINRGQMVGSLNALKDQGTLSDETFKDRTAMISCCTQNDLQMCVSRFIKVKFIIIL